MCSQMKKKGREANRRIANVPENERNDGDNI
jgi:hypothetical protein